MEKGVVQIKANVDEWNVSFREKEKWKYDRFFKRTILSRSNKLEKTVVFYWTNEFSKRFWKNDRFLLNERSYLLIDFTERKILLYERMGRWLTMNERNEKKTNVPISNPGESGMQLYKYTEIFIYFFILWSVSTYLSAGEKDTIISFTCIRQNNVFLILWVTKKLHIQSL